MASTIDRRDEAELLRPTFPPAIGWQGSTDARPETEKALAMLVDALVYSNRERSAPMSDRTRRALTHAVAVLRRRCGTPERSAKCVLDAWTRVTLEGAGTEVSNG